MRVSQMNGCWSEVEQHLNEVTGEDAQFEKKESVSGGCINQCWKVTDTKEKHWFIKTNSPSLHDMFAAEAEGLNEIADSHSIRSPKSFCYGSTEEFSYLVLEYIVLKPLINQEEAGKQLAKMHQYTFPESPMTRFGWKRDNTIGSTPQSNQQHKNWISFWKNERLLYQLKLAKKNGYSSKAYDEGLKLAESLPLFFTSYPVQASLLHGDLWGGNCASEQNGNPVIYDPAVYFGDRETDIAMTELFGGFNHDFYAAYNEQFPMNEGYKTRKTLYNLYHILNHFNLFGGGYSSQATGMTQQLLSEI